MKTSSPLRSLFSALVLIGAAGSLRAEQGVFHLPIGDPELRDREIPLTLDALTEARSGETLTPDDLASKLAGVELVFVGESHTSIDFHLVQLRVLEELVAAGRRVLIGLEMYPYTQQAHLDAWTAGHYTEEGFLELSRWYDNWGYHWHYYRDIFLFARDRGLPMVALNIPREVVRAVREKGFEGLSEEERAHVPPVVDLESEEHERLFRAFFGEDDEIHASMSPEQWDGMFRAQCTWDATMAHNALRGLQARGGEGAVMVVLIGAGHVAYGLGIERQAARSFEGEMASIVPISIEDEKGEKIATVRASYADFVWGVPPESAPLYPSLGISTRTVDDGGFSVLHVEEGSPAALAGFQVGDRLLSVDGGEITTKQQLNRHMAGKRWGDVVRAGVLRGEEKVELVAHLRRKSKE